VDRIKRYIDDVPLFSRFQIEHQIESAPHAMCVSIRRRDRHRPYRSADRDRHQLGARHQRFRYRSHRAQHQLEAAEEIARQLRLRDLGG